MSIFNWINSISWSWTLPSGYNKPTLEIELQRFRENQWCTIGALAMPGFICSTIELPSIPYQGSKVRIPAGRYALRLYNSPRWGKMVPLLVGVPERSEIEIHPSNYAIRPSDGHCLLEGCIAPGYNPSSVSVDDSTRAWSEFMLKIDPKLWSEGEIWLTIKDLPLA